MSAQPEVVDLLANSGLDAYIHFRLGGKAPRPRFQDGRLPTPAELALSAALPGRISRQHENFLPGGRSGQGRRCGSLRPRSG